MAQNFLKADNGSELVGINNSGRFLKANESLCLIEMNYLGLVLASRTVEFLLAKYSNKVR